MASLPRTEKQIEMQPTRATRQWNSICRQNSGLDANRFSFQCWNWEGQLKRYHVCMGCCFFIKSLKKHPNDKICLICLSIWIHFYTVQSNITKRLWQMKNWLCVQLVVRKVAYFHWTLSGDAVSTLLCKTSLQLTRDAVQLNQVFALPV